MNDLCTSFEIRSFTERELTFLKEYCAALSPLSRGLDILQGEDSCYYGTLLPTLSTIIRKTKAALPQLSSMTTGVAQTVQNAIEKRFSHIFESKDAIIATVTSPKFKLKWVESKEQKDTYRQMIIDELHLHVRASEVVIEEDHITQAQKNRKDFYEFDSEDEDTSDDVGAEAMEFLRNAKTLECLEKYPKIKELFLKYNTTIPCSAPVERLFSLGSLVLIPRRNRLTDGKFEQLLLMRYNKDFVDLK